MKISNDENISAWSNNAQYVIEKFLHDGDFWRKHVLNPVLLHLIGDVTNKTILDAGCGQGYLSRMLAAQGAKVTGIEPAEGLVLYAKEQEKKNSLGIQYIKE